MIGHEDGIKSMIDEFRNVMVKAPRRRQHCLCAASMLAGRFVGIKDAGERRELADDDALGARYSGWGDFMCIDTSGTISRMGRTPYCVKASSCERHDVPCASGVQYAPDQRR